MVRMIAALLTSMLLVHQVQAQGAAPTVLHDSGRSVPFSPLVAQLVAGDEAESVLQGLSFPFGTSLQPKVLERDGVQVLDPTWLTQPLAIVAAEDLSMRWLQFNRDTLLQLGAVVLVVQAQNAQGFKQLQELVQPIGIAPEVSPWLAERLHAAGAGVYPVLVHTDGRAYQVLFQISAGEVQ
ncbi:PFL_4695 family integrating conjugative element protein [Comamonas aquatica]|uniref:Integrating conjugative element protein, PFL_4695 family n=1 Tax=Comamonas aquatica TaxID=225991 RepID=A0AA35GIN0_9BURK|nr:integrating conjugative element protein [Comamonas aquatica]CAB5697705.1 integrating conjugative element protein, PFL_4695 family [Comamonas aquatica]CAC9684658.1 integrating conjugative element protein, PFL_4695 family [Comamonas aquatica]